MFDPRRTVMFAVVSKVEPGRLYVQESPAEILPFRDTERVRFGYLPENSTQRTTVTITDRTCVDLSTPLEHLKPGTPLIVFGIDTGGTIEAEILADMDAEPRYRTAMLRYQNCQDWHRPMSTR